MRAWNRGEEAVRSVRRRVWAPQHVRVAWRAFVCDGGAEGVRWTCRTWKGLFRIGLPRTEKCTSSDSSAAYLMVVPRGSGRALRRRKLACNAGAHGTQRGACVSAFTLDSADACGYRPVQLIQRNALYSMLRCGTARNEAEMAIEQRMHARRTPKRASADCG
jgi:hypothetical protein